WVPSLAFVDADATARTKAVAACPRSPSPDLNARCSSLPAFTDYACFYAAAAKPKGVQRSDSSAPSLARSHFSDCDAFVTNLTMVQRTKLCRCDVSYESFAKALNSNLTRGNLSYSHRKFERRRAKLGCPDALDDNRPKSFPRRTTADADGDVTERRPRSQARPGSDATRAERGRSRPFWDVRGRARAKGGESAIRMDYTLLGVVLITHT
ncbi:hypothetical protein EVAR_81367_1, partial [Eumeta japonica]